MENFIPKYFLASNSCEGFVSKFKDFYNPYNGWKIYIIKGGPGTGKSSFMRKILQFGIQKGYTAETFPCSSDPNSLDGISFPQLKIAVFDGTSPHVLEPEFPGVCETILNFGDFWDTDCIIENSQNIIDTTTKNKNLHKTVTAYLQAAGKILNDNYKLIKGVTDTVNAEKLADRLIKKYLKQNGKKPIENERFLTGVTPFGIKFFGDTIVNSCDNIVLIKDDYGFVSSIIMEKLKNAALENKFEIISCKNFLLPQLYDHIIIPELSLAFVREDEFQHLNFDVRKIHATRFVDFEKLKSVKEKLKFNKKFYNELLSCAVDTLSQAKSVHDELEKYYINSMDFQKLEQFANKFSDKIFL